MSSSNTHLRRKRSGFTLTELLIAITIIGVLVGLLAVAGTGVIGRSREFAVSNEILQMEQAVEKFRTEYGVYPPCFEQFSSATVPGSPQPLVQAEANQVLQILNKIAPGHREADPSPTRGTAGWRRIDDWWESVGTNLNQQSSLQFWLSGMFHNQQYPLTGGLLPADFPGSNPSQVYLPVAYNAPYFLTSSHSSIDDANKFELPARLERRVLYDFDNQRFTPALDADGNELVNVSAYNMAYGKTNGDLLYLYRDSGAYLDAAPGVAPDFTPAYHFIDASGSIVFPNQNTFQLISAGLDGDFGLNGTETGLLFDKSAARLQVQLPQSDDNLCNFAGGRLDKFINDRQ